MNRTLGETIAQKRKCKKLSLRRLAAMVTREDGYEISAPYIYSIEQGYRRPSLHVLRQLATILEVNETQLLSQARKADAIVREHLEAHPEAEEVVIQIVQAVERGQVDWERLLENCKN